MSPDEEIATPDGNPDARLSRLTNVLDRLDLLWPQSKTRTRQPVPRIIDRRAHKPAPRPPAPPLPAPATAHPTHSSGALLIHRHGSTIINLLMDDMDELRMRMLVGKLEARLALREIEAAALTKEIGRA